MPKVYLKSTVYNDQNFSDGGSEKYYLDLILKEIASCINSNGISYVVKSDKDSREKMKMPPSARNQDIENDFAEINFEMHSLNESNEAQGVTIFFNEGNPESKRLSTIILENIKELHYEPSLVKALPNALYSNSNLNSIPSVKINLGNPLSDIDIEWIRDNIEEISQKIIMSLDEYFALPFVICSNSVEGIALKDESLRKRPNLNSEVVGSVEANSKVNVLGQWEDWYIVGQNDDLGYIQTKFIEY